MAGFYLNQFQELVRSLMERPDIRVLRHEIRPPASPQALDTARVYALYRLPAGVEDFYLDLNGFQLEWEYLGQDPPGEGPDRGAINLLPVEKIFGSWKGAVWFDDFEGGDRFREVKPFDFFQPEICAGFRQPLAQSPLDEVYFHPLGQDLAPTGLNFPRYLERLLAARGYLNWQQAFCAGSGRNPEVIQFFQRMPHLFSDFRAGLFQA